MFKVVLTLTASVDDMYTLISDRSYIKALIEQYFHVPFAFQKFAKFDFLFQFCTLFVAFCIDRVK